MENCFIQGQEPWHPSADIKITYLKAICGTSDSSLLDIMLRETLRKMIWYSQMVRERMKLIPNIVHGSWRKQPGEDAPCLRLEIPKPNQGHEQQKRLERLFPVWWVERVSQTTTSGRGEASLQGVLRSCACGDHLWSPRDYQCPNTALRHCAATPTCSVTREQKRNASNGRGWKNITSCQWDCRRDPRARVLPKMGSPQMQRWPGLMPALVMWRSSSSAAWQCIMWCFLTFLHGSGGTSPLLRSEGPDNNGLTAKPPDVALLLKEMATSTKPSRTTLLSIRGDCADSGRRNAKLNCRDADAGLDWSHLISPDFPRWMLTPQSGGKHPSYREWRDFCASKLWPPALYLQDGGHRGTGFP